MGKNKNKKKRSAGDILLTIILIIAIGVFCFAGFNLFNIFMEYKKGTDEYNHIIDMVVTEISPDKLEETEEETKEESQEDNSEKKEKILQAPININFEPLKKINDDVIGWIYMEALENINYPVVQGEDNEMYLHTTYEKNYNFAGTIFVDCANSADFSDCNTLVYGHNMKNGSMFAQLKKYCSDQEVYKKSPYFWILTPEKNYKYEIISAHTTPVNSETYTLFKGPGEEFEKFLHNMVEASEIKTNSKELSKEDKVVTLSTCTGNNATRFVVQGRCIAQGKPK